MSLAKEYKCEGDVQTFEEYIYILQMSAVDSPLKIRRSLAGLCTLKRQSASMDIGR